MLARITLCLACDVPVCHCMNLACFVTSPLNKALQMDPHVSCLVRPIRFSCLRDEVGDTDPSSPQE